MHISLIYMQKIHEEWAPKLDNNERWFDGRIQLPRKEIFFFFQLTSPNEDDRTQRTSQHHKRIYLLKTVKK